MTRNKKIKRNWYYYFYEEIYHSCLTAADGKSLGHRGADFYFSIIYYFTNGAILNFIFSIFSLQDIIFDDYFHVYFLVTFLLFLILEWLLIYRSGYKNKFIATYQKIKKDKLSWYKFKGHFYFLFYFLLYAFSPLVFYIISL